MGRRVVAGLRTAGLWDNLRMSDIVPSRPSDTAATPVSAVKELSAAARAFIALQHVLPQHGISRLVHAAARSQTPWFKNLLISQFIQGFRPDLGEALVANPLEFKSFNAFFTRALRADARRMPEDPLALACPVDGTVSEIGVIEGERLLQAKGRYYTLDALLAGRRVWVERFTGGLFATIYLAPHNYHRIHMSTAGVLREAWYVPGRLFSVNRVTADGVAHLFARNERVVCFFEDGALQHGLALIGALNVGSMETVWHGEVAPRKPRTLARLEIEQGGKPYAALRGEEMGRFNMGSTVILLFPKNSIEWAEDLASGQTVCMGQTIGRRLA